MTHDTNTGLVLNIGCGNTKIDGAINIDIKDDGLDARKLPFANGSCKKIYCSHLLEHFNRYEATQALEHWVNLLDVGGELFIAVPNAKQLMADMNESNWSELSTYVCGGCTDDNDVHKTQFVPHMLMSMMRFAGLKDINEFEPFVPDCSNYPFSLNLCGTKRDKSLPENPLVIALMPEPRLTFSAYHACWREVIRTCQIGECRVGGAFWEKSLEHGIIKALEAGADIILFGDYDTLFTPDDYKMLLDDITSNPEVDAVAGVQMSRHDERPLVMEDNLDYTTDLTRVRFAHFGFTMVKASCFHELPRPWFMNVPGKEGWDTEGQSDADISFWRMLHTFGFGAYWDNRVILGHMELCAIWPYERGVMYQPVRDYTANGRPEAAKFVPEVFQRVVKKKIEAEEAAKQEADPPDGCGTVKPKPGIEQLVHDAKEGGKAEPLEE